MAKKKKDEIEENKDLNQDQTNEFNEADDNFGLPDVEYKPLDEEREEEKVESTHEETTYEREEVYASVADDREEEVVYEKEYVPGNYTPPKEESSAGKIIVAILILLLVGVGIWYFGFHRPEQAREQARIEKQRQNEEAKRLAAQRKAEEERRAREEAEAEAARLAEEEEASRNKVGTVETISSRTGRYYVVVASALDGDLAMDYANKISKEQGKDVQIIPPFGKSKFHRIALADLDSWASAQNLANDMKGEYGDGVWVIKY